MTKEKDTSVDQVYALSIRIAKFLRRKVERFDGDLFQEAINKREHTFWKKMDDLCESSFTIPFEFRVIGKPCRITINDGRGTEELLNAMGEENPRIYPEGRHILNCTDETICNNPEDVELVFLYPTREVAQHLVLNEIKIKGWENCELNDSLRLIEKYPSHVFVSCGKYNHNIAFISKTSQYNNIELGYDGMGCHFLDISTHTSLCYAARRRIKAR
ncbi:MAG: hypothetical protein Q7S72_01160 [Candidatus Taylorbacteria bacterium]|nr:hypothetical protein [Candidatus Taylorbacteria bacterium]